VLDGTLWDTFIDLSTTGMCHVTVPKEINFQQPNFENHKSRIPSLVLHKHCQSHATRDDRRYTRYYTCSVTLIMKCALNFMVWMGVEAETCTVVLH